MPVNLSRRTALQGLAAIASGLTAGQIVAAAGKLPTAESLPMELKQALASGYPLVVMVSLEGCPFCKVARENYLIPMQTRQGLPVVQVDMRSKSSLRTFQDTLTTHDDWIRAVGIKVAPTLLFFGRGGVEIAERMNGGYIPDFYGAYLDERLKQAKSRINV